MSRVCEPAGVLLAVSLAALGGATGGCGRKAPPVPPVIQQPERTGDLTVFQEGTQAVLSWGYPAATTAGAALPPLEAVEVWRLTLPSTQEPAGTSPQELRVRRQLMESRGLRLRRLAGEEIELATRGPSMELRDDLRRWRDEEGERGNVVWYAVVSVCCKGRPSEMSNIARLLPQLPPPPPEGLAAQASSEGITLRWTAEPERGALVERSGDGEVWERVTPEAIVDGQWLDHEAGQGRTWRYRLRTVETVPGGTRLVGDPGDAVSVDHPDLYPPPQPANLVCLPEGGQVRLRWDAIGEEITFTVFRQLAGGEPETVIQGLSATGYEDAEAVAGTWTYGVRSVDRAGNESEPATCSTVVAPAP